MLSSGAPLSYLPLRGFIGEQLAASDMLLLPPPSAEKYYAMDFVRLRKIGLDNSKGALPIEILNMQPPSRGDSDLPAILDFCRAYSVSSQKAEEEEIKLDAEQLERMESRKAAMEAGEVNTKARPIGWERKVASMVGVTRASEDECIFYLEAQNWDAPKATQLFYEDKRIGRRRFQEGVSTEDNDRKLAEVAEEEVQVELHAPGRVVVTSQLRASQTCFDLHCLGYQHLQDKTRGFVVYAHTSRGRVAVSPSNFQTPLASIGLGKRCRVDVEYK